MTQRATDARGVELMPGFRVYVPPHESSLGGFTPPFHGVVTSVGTDSVTILCFKTLGMRSFRSTDVRVQRTWIKLMDKFLESSTKTPGPNSRGRISNPGATENTPGQIAIHKMVLLYGKSTKYRSVLITGLSGDGVDISQEEKDNLKMAAVKTESAKAKRSKVDFSDMTPGDFFNENKKGKVVFRPGFDAKLKSLLLKVAAGEASATEKKLAFHKNLIGNPKVTGSHFFPALIENAKKAA